MNLLRIFDDLGAIHVTIQKSNGTFQVNYRLPDRGFTCAQKQHATIEDAIREHLPTDDPSDGLLDL